MRALTGWLARGLAAGAAGTTALNAVTYLDMAARGRPASELPEQSVNLLAERLGTDIPGGNGNKQNRVQGLGALLGIATGLAGGVVATAVRPLLRRVPLGVGAVVVGGIAMAGSDVPMVRLRLTDPSSWSAAEWASDAAPHLVYGVVTAWTARRL
jgi:hypothetical protein